MCACALLTKLSHSYTKVAIFQAKIIENFVNKFVKSKPKDLQLYFLKSYMSRATKKYLAINYQKNISL